MRGLHQSKLRSETGENEKENEVVEMRGGAGTVHCAKDKISIMSLSCSTQTKND